MSDYRYIQINKNICKELKMKSKKHKMSMSDYITYLGEKYGHLSIFYKQYLTFFDKLNIKLNKYSDTDIVILALMRIEYKEEEK